MKCGRCEELLALYVEGDLPEGKARRVEGHLAGCARCREAAAALESSQAVFKSLASEPVEEAVYDRIRAGVMSRVGSQQHAAWGRRWAYAAAMAAAAILVLLALQPDRAPRPAAPAPVIARTAPPEPPQVRPQTGVKPAARRPPRRVQKPAAPAEPLLVKIETDDPNVVIYWIVDDTGE
jgi:hypothetical protein